MKGYMLAIIAIAVLCVASCSRSKEDATVQTGVAPSVSAPSAGSGYPAEVQKAMDRMVSIMDGSAEKLEKAATDKDVAAALEYYGVQMKDVVAQAKALHGKYPSLALLTDEAGRVRDGTSEAVEQASDRFMKAMMAALQKYPTSPAIMKAYEHIGAMAE